MDISFVLTLLSIFLGYKWQTSSKENEKLKDRLNEKKDQLYAEFINIYMQVVNKKIDEKETIERMRGFNEKLLLVGSNNVILTYGDLFGKLQQAQTKEDDEKSLRYFGELIIAMRKDLGNKDWLSSLKWFDVLRPWVKDMDKKIAPQYLQKEGTRRTYLKN